LNYYFSIHFFLYYLPPSFPFLPDPSPSASQGLPPLATRKGKVDPFSSWFSLYLSFFLLSPMGSPMKDSFCFLPHFLLPSRLFFANQAMIEDSALTPGHSSCRLPRRSFLGPTNYSSSILFSGPLITFFAKWLSCPPPDFSLFDPLSDESLFLNTDPSPACLPFFPLQSGGLSFFRPTAFPFSV